MGEDVEHSETDEVVKNNEILQNDPSVCHPERSVAESNAERDASIGIYNGLYCVPFKIPLRALLMVGFDYENITP